MQYSTTNRAGIALDQLLFQKLLADLYFRCCCYLSVTRPRVSLCSVRLLDDRHTFNCNDYFVLGGIRTCLGVSIVPVDFFEFLSTEFAVRSKPQAEIIIVKRLVQERNNVTRVRVQPRSCDQGRSESDAFTHSAMLATTSSGNTAFDLTEPIAKPRNTILIFFRQSTFHGSVLHRPLGVSSRGERHFFS